MMSVGIDITGYLRSEDEKKLLIFSLLSEENSLIQTLPYQ